MSKTQDRWIEQDGQTIRYRVIASGNAAKDHAKDQAKDPSSGRVLILPGFTEFIEKHEITASRLNAMGLDCLVIDWPGQGLSGRLSPKYPHVAHCRDFSDHLKALQVAAGEAGFLDGSMPLFLFGHSMGGHLALRVSRILSCPIAGAVLSAPMMMPPVLPPGLIRGASGMLCRLGLAGYPVRGRHGKPRDDQFYALNPLTRSPKGYRVQVDWWNRNPALKTTGPSFGWVNAAYTSCLATTGNAKWLAGVQCPVQVHLADHEVIVSRLHAYRMTARLPRAEIHHYPSARHELLLELPDVVELLWQRVGEFINTQLEED